MYENSAKQNNCIKFNNDSKKINILDFYDSLQCVSKVVAAINGAFNELNDLHKPDNGLMTTCMEISTLKFIHAELKLLKGEKT